jgi:hypothetical protein
MLSSLITFWTFYGSYFSFLSGSKPANEHRLKGETKHGLSVGATTASLTTIHQITICQNVNLRNVNL